MQPVPKLTARQRAFLDKLLELYRERKGPVHYSDVAERLGVNRFSAYDMLRVLEKKGFAASSYTLRSAVPAASGAHPGPGRSMVVFAPTASATEILADWGEDARIKITSSVGSAFTIPAGVTLTIGAGSVIVIDPGLEIEVLGNIVVNGTLAEPVVFTAQDRNVPWGGFLLEASTSVANITNAILTAACADSNWFSTHHSGDHRHRQEQCLFYLGNGAHLALTNCYMVEKTSD